METSPAARRGHQKPYRPPSPVSGGNCSNSICEITKAPLPHQQTGWKSRSRKEPHNTELQTEGFGWCFFSFSSSNLEFLVWRLTAASSKTSSRTLMYWLGEIRPGSKTMLHALLLVTCTTPPSSSKGSTHPAVSPSHNVVISNRPFNSCSN